MRRKCPGTELARLQAFAARARSSDARGCSGVRSGGKAARCHLGAGLPSPRLHPARPKPSLHRFFYPRVGHRWRPTWLQRFLDPLQLRCPGLGQAPGLLLLLAGRRQAGHRRRRLNRGAVGKPGDGLTQRQIGVEPGGAPAFGVALCLPDVGRPYFLHVPELLAFHPQTDPGAAIRGDAGRLPAVVPKRPPLARLDPARGDRGGAEAVGGTHGRKDTAGGRKDCDRSSC